MPAERHRAHDHAQHDQDARPLDPVTEYIREDVGEPGRHEQRSQFDQFTTLVLRESTHGNTLLTICCAPEDPP
jgi:hypothetical protein